MSIDIQSPTTMPIGFAWFLPRCCWPPVSSSPFFAVDFGRNGANDAKKTKKKNNKTPLNSAQYQSMFTFEIRHYLRMLRMNCFISPVRCARSASDDGRGGDGAFDGIFRLFVFLICGLNELWLVLHPMGRTFSAHCSSGNRV